MWAPIAPVRVSEDRRISPNLGVDYRIPSLLTNHDRLATTIYAAALYVRLAQVHTIRGPAFLLPRVSYS